jgi:hypothetical protein
MRHILLSFSFLLLVLLLSGACAKTSQNTTLILNLKTVTGDPVPSANVTLYKSQADLANNANIQDVQVTDSRGAAQFDNLGPNVYFYNAYRSTDCATNAFTKTKTNNLNAGQINNETDTLYQIGQVTFKNTSGDGYDLSVNGKPLGSIAGGISTTANLKMGSYTVHIKQNSGITGAPMEKDIPLSLSACDTKTLSFP